MIPSPVTTIESKYQAMPVNKRKRFRKMVRLAGLSVVALWLVMMGLLIRKVHFPENPVKQETRNGLVDLEGDEREWKEIFLKGRKVGYAVSMLRTHGEGYSLQEELFLRLHLMGLGHSLYATNQARLDRSLRLESFKTMMTSGFVRYEISGKVEDGALLITDERHGARQVMRMPVDEVPTLASSLPLFFRSRPLLAGEEYHLSLFDPTTLSRRSVLIKVAGKENLTMHGISYPVFRLESELWGKTLTFWVDEQGRTLKEEGFMGLTTLRSSASMAPRGMDGEEGDDLYEMFAVKADRYIPNPENLVYLKLEFEGVDFTGPYLNEARQRMEGSTLEITKEDLPSKSLPPLPIHEVPEDVAAYRAPDFNVESDDPRIKDAARRIVGDTSDPLSAAGKLLDWVYRNIEKKPVLSVPSALEVLDTRVGDCNEHAVLLTALLRAAGIPARLGIGLVYSRDRFYYHAWTEAWLGEWIAMDPIMNQMPADASHIKWAEGDLSRQVEIVRLVDALRIKVIDFRYD
jgi:hypothetical protein